jgi:hypothetical protein
VESKVSLQPAEFKRNIITAYDLRLNGEFEYLQSFLTFLPLEFWKKLASIVDHNLLKYSSTKKNPVKETSVEELIQFYGMQMELENTFGNAPSDIRQHLNQLSEKIGNRKERIGQRRFLQIRNSINPTIEHFLELLKILNKAAISTISRVSVVVCVMNKSTHINFCTPPKPRQIKLVGRSQSFTCPENLILMACSSIFLQLMSNVRLTNPESFL